VGVELRTGSEKQIASLPVPMFARTFRGVSPI
jgi:hypothetical protein